MEKPCVYIMTNKYNTTIYIGVTSYLKKRIFEHKNKIVKSFSSKYNISKLVYYEFFEDMVSAINREKQLKAGSRIKKCLLIDSFNPNWEDLYDNI